MYSETVSTPYLQSSSLSLSLPLSLLLPSFSRPFVYAFLGKVIYYSVALCAIPSAINGRPGGFLSNIVAPVDVCLICNPDDAL